MLMQKIRGNIANRKGFTLVELLVVVAILGILAALVVPKFTSSTESAKKAKIKADLRTIDSAISVAETDGTAVAPGAVTVAALPNLASVPTPPSGLTGVIAKEYKITSVGGAMRGTLDGKVAEDSMAVWN